MIYENLIKNTNTIKSVFNVHFVEGPFIEIKSTNEDELYCDILSPNLFMLTVIVLAINLIIHIIDL